MHPMRQTITPMTCVTCPIGCSLLVTTNERGEIISVSGNTCKRGEAYAKAELTHPVRTLTTTLKVKGKDERLPVKTSLPISREKLLSAMISLRGIEVDAPVTIGQVILKDFMDECDLVACADIEG